MSQRIQKNFEEIAGRLNQVLKPFGLQVKCLYKVDWSENPTKPFAGSSIKPGMLTNEEAEEVIASMLKKEGFSYESNLRGSKLKYRGTTSLEKFEIITTNEELAGANLLKTVEILSRKIEQMNALSKSLEELSVNIASTVSQYPNQALKNLKGVSGSLTNLQKILPK